MVTDLPASGPFTMDTLALAIGTEVRLVMTVPLSENLVPVDGAEGEVNDVSLPPQATAARRRSEVHNQSR